jgi:hypothetical protein
MTEPEPVPVPEQKQESEQKQKPKYRIAYVRENYDYFKDIDDNNTKESIKDYYYCKTEGNDCKYFIGKLFIQNEITSYQIKLLKLGPIYERVYYFIKNSENQSEDNIMYRSVDEMPVIYEENIGVVNNAVKNAEALGRGGAGANRSRGRKRSRRNKKQRKNKTKSKK